MCLPLNVCFRLVNVIKFTKYSIVLQSGSEVLAKKTSQPDLPHRWWLVPLGTNHSSGDWLIPDLDKAKIWPNLGPGKADSDVADSGPWFWFTAPESAKPREISFMVMYMVLVLVPSYVLISSHSSHLNIPQSTTISKIAGTSMRHVCDLCQYEAGKISHLK